MTTGLKTPRIVDPAAGREKLLREGRCRLCGRTAGLTRMHVVSKARLGHDVDDNIVPGCLHPEPGVAGCHHQLDHGKHRLIARQLLYRRLTEAELEHGRARAAELGWDFDAYMLKDAA